MLYSNFHSRLFWCIYLFASKHDAKQCLPKLPDTPGFTMTSLSTLTDDTLYLTLWSDPYGHFCFFYYYFFYLILAFFISDALNLSKLQTEKTLINGGKHKNMWFKRGVNSVEIWKTLSDELCFIHFSKHSVQWRFNQISVFSHSKDSI